MQELLEAAIIRKAKGVLRSQRIDQAAQRKNAERYEKRTGLMAGSPSLHDPAWWSYHPHFDPRYCIKHAKYISRVIWRRLQANLYSPVPAIQFDVPKPDGSSRQIMAFAVPDAALAKVIHRNVTARNLNLFSAYSFAYRPDKNVFDAILHLKRSLSNPKSYIIQYDFSKYFDSISHDYLRRIVNDPKVFLLSEAERFAIGAFLNHDFCHVRTYQDNVFDVRERGVPQGSSLSLFLSNAAAHELDLRLENQNGTFVRFADDVVAITHSYQDALAVAAQFRRHCHDAGLQINYEKSPGILLFGGGPERERRRIVIDTDDASLVKTIRHIDYLGHRILSEGVSLPEKTIKRIKAKISSIVHKHLFLHRRGAGGALAANRIGPGFMDWDLVTCINEIRRYVYGGLREAQLNGFIEDDEKLPFVRGLMSFLPLHTNVEAVRELDGWLINILSRAQRERAKVVATFGHTQVTLSKDQMIDGSWYSYPAVFNDSRVPSFVRAWRASRKYYLRYGLASIDAPSYYSTLTY